MKKTFCMLSIILFFTLILIVGCTNTNEKVATISVNSDSEYVNTFEDLNFGILFDYNFTLYNADKRWVNLWVERYIDGEKDSQPLKQLSYGESPNEVDQGHLGFGILNLDTEDTIVFLYGPGVRSSLSIDEKEPNTHVISAWDYAIGNKKVELEIGETKILAVYWETEGNTIHAIDLQDDNSVNEIINQNNTVLLLKLKIEERK